MPAEGQESQPTVDPDSVAGPAPATAATSESGRTESIDSATRQALADIEAAAADRLSFFSDAVVAIAITLLAIDLPVPHGTTDGVVLDALGRNADSYLAFLISFAVIATHWFQHHRVFRYLHRLGGRLVVMNTAWLLLIVLTPFATKLLSDDGMTLIRFSIYAGIQCIQASLFALMIWRMEALNLLHRAAPRRILRRSIVASLTIAAMFGISIPVYAVLGRVWAFACWIAAAGLVRVTVVADDRRADRARPPDDGQARSATP